MSTGRSDADLRHVDGIDWPVLPVRHATVRGYRLAVVGYRQLVRLTLPRRAALGPALAWAAGQGDWLRCQIEKAASAEPIAPGSIVAIEGRPVRIDWAETHPRRVTRDGDRLIVGGPQDRVGARVLRWLKAEALAVLSTDTRALAERHDLPLRHVAIGDPRARWGSCSSSGVIRYSWRLIMAPPDVRRATVAHEVAHLRHMDHSAAFHAFHRAISDMDADLDAARAWLRTHGRALHRITA